MTYKVQIGLRVSAELKYTLEQIAERENRSVNNLIETILQKVIEGNIEDVTKLSQNFVTEKKAL